MIKAVNSFRFMLPVLLLLSLFSCITTDTNDSRFMNARIAYGNEDFTDAVLILDGILDIDPQNENALLLRGFIHQHLHNYQSSILDYESLLEVAPNHYMVYCNLGNIYLSLSEYDRAIGYYTEAIEVNDSFEGAYLNRANTYIKMGKYYEARKDYTHYLLLSSDQKDNIEKLILLLDDKISSLS